MERGIRNRTISLYILAELWYAFISRCLMIYYFLQKVYKNIEMILNIRFYNIYFISSYLLSELRYVYFNADWDFV